MTIALAAQAATANFFAVYEVSPGVDFAHLTPGQLGILQQHGMNLERLRQGGKIVTGGRITYDPQHARGVVILAVGSEAEAQEIVAADPAVRAGVMRAKVEPIDLVIPPASSAAIVADSRATYAQVTGYVLAAAKTMPEAQYGFRPTAEVRTFGQLLGHIAESEGLICAAARGVKAKPRDIEKTVTGKAELIAALENASASCQETWAATTDLNAAAPATLRNTPRTRLGVLDFNSAHTFEHYGNLVTYLRLQHLVPPSSQ
jgi:uncharacterized damage-inducible protein DinB/uncharacterized protein YciI